MRINEIYVNFYCSTQQSLTHRKYKTIPVYLQAFQRYFCVFLFPESYRLICSLCGASICVVSAAMFQPVE